MLTMQQILIDIYFISKIYLIFGVYIDKIEFHGVGEINFHQTKNFPDKWNEQ